MNVTLDFAPAAGDMMFCRTRSGNYFPPVRMMRKHLGLGLRKSVQPVKIDQKMSSHFQLPENR